MFRVETYVHIKSPPHKKKSPIKIMGLTSKRWEYERTRRVRNVHNIFENMQISLKSWTAEAQSPFQRCFKYTWTHDDPRVRLHPWWLSAQEIWEKWLPSFKEIKPDLPAALANWIVSSRKIPSQLPTAWIHMGKLTSDKNKCLENMLSPDPLPQNCWIIRAPQPFALHVKMLQMLEFLKVPPNAR